MMSLKYMYFACIYGIIGVIIDNKSFSYRGKKKKCIANVNEEYYGYSLVFVYLFRNFQGGT